MATLHFARARHEEAIASIERAVGLMPNNWINQGVYGWILNHSGQPRKALSHLRISARLNPNYPYWVLREIGHSQQLMGEQEKALATLRTVLARKPDRVTTMLALVRSAIMLAERGKEAEARALVTRALAVYPRTSIEFLHKSRPYKNAAIYRRWDPILRKLGLPDGTMVLPLPKKPSIVVLPLRPVGDDKLERRVAVGLTENLIGAMGRIPRLFVIARSTSFAVTQKSSDPVVVSRTLGVRYILAGSVQASRTRIRVSMRLIDGIRGKVLWTRQLNKALNDLLELQDDITRATTTAIDIRLTDGEIARISGRGTRSFDAWMSVREGVEIFRRFTKVDNLRARKLARKALAIDEKYPAAYRLLGWTHNLDAQAKWSGSRERSLEKADAAAGMAMKLHADSALNFALLASNALIRRDYKKAIALYRKSIDLNPNNSFNHVLFGYALSFAGHHKEALDQIKRGIRLSPFGPAFFYLHLAQVNLMLRRYRRTIELARIVDGRKDYRGVTHHLWRAAALVELGRLKEARESVQSALAHRPKLSLRHLKKIYPFRKKADAEWLAGALRSAGLPE